MVDLVEQVHLALLEHVGARLGRLVEHLDGHVLARLLAYGLVDERGGAGAYDVVLAPLIRLERGDLRLLIIMHSHSLFNFEVRRCFLLLLLLSVCSLTSYLYTY